MATQRQVQANRRNAQKSTGPKTPEGKAAVRLNAVRLGLRASTVVLPNESSEDFKRLCDDLEAELQPQTRIEQFYAEQMPICQWKLRRLDIAEKRFIINGSDGSDLPHLNIVWQEARRLERFFARAQRDLMRLQDSAANRSNNPGRPPLG